jgi:hypothetical protein
MKKSFINWVLALSFALFSACGNFDEEIIHEMATFTLTIPGGTVQLSGNPILITCTTTTLQDGVNVNDHRLLLKITCTDSAIPGGPWTDSIAPLNGSATFNISEIVDTEFTYDFITSLLTRFQERDALAADISVEVGECYYDANGDFVETWNTDPASTLTILKGKLTRHEFNVLSANSSSFYSVFINGDRWLTKLERNQTDRLPEVVVSSVSDEVKAWFAVGSAKSYTIKSVTYFSDGTSETYTDPASPYTCSVGKAYEVDLHKYVYNPNNKTVTKYYVSISGTDRIFWVIVDNKNYDNHNVLFFANSVGGVEALHCFGRSTEDISVKGETVTNDALTFTAKTPTVKMTQGQYNTRYKINTGFKSLSERKWIKDLLISDNVWMKIDYPLYTKLTAINLMPVTIVPGSYTIDDSSEDLMSIEFEIEVAHEY